MAKLSRKHLQQFMRDNMTYDEYSFDQMFMLYKELLNRDGMLEYEPMSIGTLKRLINEWANAEDGWLIRSNNGIAPKYHKWRCHRNNLSRKGLRDIALCLLNRGRALWPQ